MTEKKVDKRKRETKSENNRNQVDKERQVQEERQYEQQKADLQFEIENAWEKALAVEARTMKMIVDGQEK